MSWQEPTEIAVRGADGVFSPELGCSLLANPAEDSTLGTFCRDNYNVLGLVAFTDGSYTAHAGCGGTCGFAAVLIRVEDYLDPTFTFAEGNHVTLSGAAPLAGANYAAEVKALLAVLHCVPLGVPLLCISDALSALQVLWKPILANGARVRAGARSLVTAARVLLERRSAHTTSESEHVYSHTGGTSLTARGNTVADKGAQEAATPCGPALAADEPCVFWEERKGKMIHVHGDLRKSLVSRATAACAEKWSACRSQGKTLRKLGSSNVLALTKLARGSRDAPLLTFCLKATTLQLSTSDRTRYRAERKLKGRWRCRRCEVTLPEGQRKAHMASDEHHKTPPPPLPPVAPCPMCGAPQRHMHPFACPSSQPGLNEAASHLRDLCRVICVDAALRDPPAVRAEHRQAVLDLPQKHPFFCFPSTDSPEEDDEFLQSYGHSLGVTQTLSHELLRPEYLTDNEAAVKALRKSIPASLEGLSLAALREAKAIHNLWWARVRKHTADREDKGTSPLLERRDPPCPPAGKRARHRGNSKAPGPSPTAGISCSEEGKRERRPTARRWRGPEGGPASEQPISHPPHTPPSPAAVTTHRAGGSGRAAARVQPSLRLGTVAGERHFKDGDGPAHRQRKRRCIPAGSYKKLSRH